MLNRAIFAIFGNMKNKNATILVGGIVAALSIALYLGGSLANQAAFALQI